MSDLEAVHCHDKTHADSGSRLSAANVLPFWVATELVTPMLSPGKGSMAILQVLWEMLTKEVPFQHLSPQQIIAGLMVGNLQPDVSLPICCTHNY